MTESQHHDLDDLDGDLKEDTGDTEDTEDSALATLRTPDLAKSRAATRRIFGRRRRRAAHWKSHRTVRVIVRVIVAKQRP